MINVTYKGKVVGKITQRGIRVLDEQLSSAEFVPDKLIREAKYIYKYDDVLIIDHGIFKLELDLGKIDDIIVLNNSEDILILKPPILLEKLSVLRAGIISGNLFYPILLDRINTYMPKDYVNRVDALFRQVLGNVIDYIIYLERSRYEGSDKYLTSVAHILEATTKDTRIKNYILPLHEYLISLFAGGVGEDIPSVEGLYINPLFNRKDEVVGFIHLPITGKLYVTQQPVISLDELEMVSSDDVKITPTTITVGTYNLRVEYEAPILQDLIVNNEDFMNKLSQLSTKPNRASFYIFVGKSVFPFSGNLVFEADEKKSLDVRVSHNRILFKEFDFRYIDRRTLIVFEEIVHGRLYKRKAKALWSVASLSDLPPAAVKKLWKLANPPSIDELLKKISRSKALSRFIDDNPELFERLLVLHSILAEK